MIRVRVVATAVMTSLLVGACGSAGGPSGPTGTASATGSLTPASPAPTSSALASPPAAASVTASPAPASGAPVSPAPGGRLRTVPAEPPRPSPGGVVTISGTVEAGVEAGCLLLRGYLLIGGRDQGLRAGATVTVTGRTEADLLSTCQQGTPLRVDSVRLK